jgi:hypothetical protein
VIADVACFALTCVLVLAFCVGGSSYATRRLVK